MTSNAGGLEFTEAAEFARGIQLIQPEDKVKQEEGGHMGIEEPGNASAPAAPRCCIVVDRASDLELWFCHTAKADFASHTNRSGDWAASENDMPKREPEIADEDMCDAEGLPVKNEESDEDDDEDAGIVRERGIGKGLAGALSLLQNRGELNKDVEWSGRSNDMKPNALRVWHCFESFAACPAERYVMLLCPVQGLDEVYKGGRHDHRLAEKIESALTQRDEYGRVMTPKERFRQLAYQCVSCLCVKRCCMWNWSVWRKIEGHAAGFMASRPARILWRSGSARQGRRWSRSGAPPARPTTRRWSVCVQRSGPAPRPTW